MQYPERVSFGETAFKRLYWSGYKGRFALFSWPTGWFDKPSHVYGASQLSYIAGHQQNYGNSEALARMIGPKLANLFVELGSEKNIRVFAHSMGNVVVSEALRSSDSPLVKSYVASQAAEVAGAYNGAQPLLGDPEDRWRFWNVNGLDTEYDMPPDHYRFTIPALHGPTTPEWESTIVAKEHWGSSYYAGIRNSGGRITNFFNPLDAALSGWEINQFSKPDYVDGPTWNYEFIWNCPYSALACTLDGYPDGEDGEQVSDKYTRASERLTWNRSSPLSIESANVLAHITPTRTNALGQVPSTGPVSVISSSTLLSFGKSNQGHSAQFYNNYAARNFYWIQLQKSLGLEVK